MNENLIAKLDVLFPKSPKQEIQEYTEMAALNPGNAGVVNFCNKKIKELETKLLNGKKETKEETN